MVHESPVTRASLLMRLRDGSNQDDWREFVELYSPLVYGFVRNRGLQDADAADLLQDVLRSVAGAMDRLDYDKQKGGFRAWLFTITRNKLSTFLTSRRSHNQASGDSGQHELLAAHPDSSRSLKEDWEREFQRQLAAQAMQTIQTEFEGKTWQAFWQTAVEGQPAAEVSRLIGLSPGAIYVAKSRVLTRLKAEVERLMVDAE
ncbi:MAG: sigma-70 family RNA polymerase sigma factor [Planctomycetia bacterium]|nr:sigma-70 family RNA polymerase sigma factor [Planctomycetia bacterium]